MSEAQPWENAHYLAKDYASFRALMLEHLAIQVPAGISGDAASLEITLVEVLAYVADYLSYYQDAVATEAYLMTARHRLSIRRHARLLDHRLSEGCSARTWAHLETAADHVPVPRGTALLVKIPGIDAVAAPVRLETEDRVVFETMHDAVLMRAHNRMALFEPQAALRPGDTAVRLAGSLQLAVGDVLVLQHATERYSHAVRLTGISAIDALSTAVEWHDEDELPADLPVSGAWAVLGNIVLADHGETVERDFPAIPREGSFEMSVSCPNLANVTPYRHGEALGRPAAQAMSQDPHAAAPAIWLSETAGFLTDEAIGHRASWTGCRGIVHATQFDRSFAVESADGGELRLRFGDGVHGRRLQPDWRYRMRCRVGQGVRGNIGPNTLAHIVTDDDRIVGVTNPMAGSGGADPETIDHARAAAPHAGDDQRRCVSIADYIAMTNRFAGVQASVAERASPRKGGAVSIHVRRRGDRAVDAAFEERLLAYLAPFRLIGDEVRIFGAAYVTPVVKIELGVHRGSRFSSVADAVRARLLAELSFDFGQALDPARLVACAAAVVGVADARVTELARDAKAEKSATAPAAPLEVASFEIIRLERANLIVTGRPDR